MMFSLETQPVWGNLQCHEAMTLIFYSGLAILTLLFVPRWMRWKLDTMFLKAVSRKARERQENPMLSHSADQDTLNIGPKQTELSPEEEEALLEKELGDLYNDECEDPDYMALQDDGCGDYIVSRLTVS